MNTPQTATLLIGSAKPIAGSTLGWTRLEKEASSAIATRVMMPMGKCTASVWKRPRKRTKSGGVPASGRIKIAKTMATSVNASATYSEIDCDLPGFIGLAGRQRQALRGLERADLVRQTPDCKQHAARREPSHAREKHTFVRRSGCTRAPKSCFRQG